MYRLITGCGRSGTKYITKVLELSGLDVKHEGFGKDGSVSWPLAVNADEYPEYHEEVFKLPKFDVVLHQTRHPLKTIKSFMVVASPSSWNFVYNHTPITEDMSLLDRAVRYWYYWNLQAESIADMTYRIENLKGRWEEFCGMLKIKLPYRKLREIPKNTNTKPKTKSHRKKLRRKSEFVKWSRIKRETGFYNRVVKLGRKYGYKI